MNRAFLAIVLVAAIVAVDCRDTRQGPPVEVEVSCGNHNAAKCSECPQGNGAAGCKGDCMWDSSNSVCKEKCNTATPYSVCKDSEYCKAGLGNSEGVCAENVVETTTEVAKTTTPDAETTIQGCYTTGGKRCIFPFIYKSPNFPYKVSQYTKCTQRDCGIPPNVYCWNSWCATEVDDEETWKNGMGWGECAVNWCDETAIHCEWDDWVPGTCSEECGTGTRNNTRTKKVVEKYGGTCTGQDTEVEECKIKECAVNCDWGPWEVTDCGKTCGGGMQTKTRKITIEAKHEGKACTGESNITVSCNVQECPVCTFARGDGTGGREQDIGKAKSEDACAQLVRLEKPRANGATFGSGSGEQSCFAEFGATGSNDSPSWRTCLFA